jgi:hypothetical protein
LSSTSTTAIPARANTYAVNEPTGPPPATEGELRGLAVGEVAHTELVQDPVHSGTEAALLPHGSGSSDGPADKADPAAQIAADEHVVAGGHPGEQARRLEGARQPTGSDDVRRGSGQVHAVEHDRALRRGEVAGEQVEQRGLACTVRSDDREDLPLVQDEVNLVDGTDAAELFGQPTRLEEHLLARLVPVGLVRTDCGAGRSGRRRAGVLGLGFGRARVASRPSASNASSSCVTRLACGRRSAFSILPMRSPLT